MADMVRSVKVVGLQLRQMTFEVDENLTDEQAQNELRKMMNCDLLCAKWKYYDEPDEDDNVYGGSNWRTLKLQD